MQDIWEKSRTNACCSSGQERSNNKYLDHSLISMECPPGSGAARKRDSANERARGSPGWEPINPGDHGTYFTRMILQPPVAGHMGEEQDKSQLVS